MFVLSTTYQEIVSEKHKLQQSATELSEQIEVLRAENRSLQDQAEAKSQSELSPDGHQQGGDQVGGDQVTGDAGAG